MATDTVELHDLEKSHNEAPLSALSEKHHTETVTEQPTLEPIESNNNNNYAARPDCFRSTLQECLFVLTTTVAVGMSSIVGGAVLCVTNSIGKSLDMTAAEVSWLWAGQNLASGAFLLLFGRVADLFGRRIQLLWSMSLFTICLLVAGFATNAVYMDVFLGLIGVCCAASVPPAIGKLGAVYDKPSYRKNRAFACFSAGYPVGFVIGAFIAGVSAEVADWRASFWVMCVIYVFFTGAAVWTVPADAEQSLGGFNRKTLSQFDFLGAILAVAGLGMFAASLTLAGSSPHGWKTSYVIAMLVVGVVFIVVCLVWQRIYKHPLMPLGIWKDRNFTLLVATLCLGYYGFTGNLFWISLVWQRIDQDSPLIVAVKLLPAAIGGIAVNIIAGLIMHKVSNKLLMFISASSLVIASTLWSASTVSISYWAISFPALIFSVIGADFAFTVTNMYVMSSMPSDKQSIAGAIFNTATRLAATVGIAAQTSVFNGVGGEAEGPASLRYQPYKTTFWVALGGAVLGVILVPFISIGTQGGRRKQKR